MSKKKAGKAQPMDDGLFKCKTGVVLKMRPIQRWILRERLSQIEEPQPPIVFIESKGRDEPNPADPDYVKAVNEFNAEITRTMANLVIALGTTLKTTPKDMPGPDDEEWIEQFEAAGFTIEQAKTKRYVQWVKLVAFDGSLEEVGKILATSGRQLGATEEDVASMEESFRGL